MKTKLLILFCFILFSISAQTTHDLDWDTNVGTSLDVAIDVGDTVRWTWTDTFNHSVFSSSGSEGGFDSGFKQGINLIYEKMFTKVEANPYICGVHTSTMGGTITVQTLGVEDFSLKSFLIKPNPSSFSLNIELPNNITNAKVEVYDVLGKQIYNKEITKTPIDIADWSRGVYLVRVSTSNATHTKRFVKQ
jgi:plastocyanin